MLNKKQVEKIPADLDLEYHWTRPIQGADSIIVEDTIEFKFFSGWVKDLRTGENFHSEAKFRELCTELAEKK